jgi:SAM-dependent methyltransferase
VTEKVIAQVDVEHLKIIRRNVDNFLCHSARKYCCERGRGHLLDIAPQTYGGARPFFPETVKVETFDIDPSSGCTYIGDICSYNSFLADDKFDFVVCTEVLEHTLQPFNAVNEIWRILSPGGMLFLSTPFNYRIHGPLPDCWRFTEHGLRTLLENFEILELQCVETPDRCLMPIHYTVVARKCK